MKRVVWLLCCFIFLYGCSSNLDEEVAVLKAEIIEKDNRIEKQQVKITELEDELVICNTMIADLEENLTDEKNNSVMMLEEMKNAIFDSIDEDVSIEIQKTIYSEVEKYLVKEAELYPEYNYVDYRIEEISHVINFENISSRNISLYRVKYRLKSLTPENILMAGGMEATEDGWIYTLSPNGTYLIFENNESYLCDVFINDAQPHTKVFKQDVERRLLEFDDE